MKHGNKKKQLQHNQNKHLAMRKVKLKYTLGLKEMGIIIIINTGIGTYSVKVTT